MRAEELKDLIQTELAENPELYSTVIAPALAGSGLRCEHVIGTYADMIGLEVGKTQRRWMQELDNEAEEYRQSTEAWEKKHRKRYRMSDFPEWVIAAITKGGKNLVAESNKIARAAMQIEKYADEFCLRPDGAMFTEMGYKFLIMSSESRGWMNTLDRKRWQKESGVFISE